MEPEFPFIIAVLKGNSLGGVVAKKYRFFRKHPSAAALSGCCESVALSVWTVIRTVFGQRAALRSLARAADVALAMRRSFGSLRKAFPVTAVRPATVLKHDVSRSQLYGRVFRCCRAGGKIPPALADDWCANHLRLMPFGDHSNFWSASNPSASRSLLTSPPSDIRILP